MNKDKKNHYIYLAGNISEDVKTYEWREQFSKEFEDVSNVRVINPCANGFNRQMRNNDGNGLDFVKKAKKLSQNILRAKDYQLIKICSIVIAHLGYTKPEKPLIGTIQELTWAHDVFYIPIIGVTNGEDNSYTNHPWIDECCSAKVDTLEEAIMLVKTFFLEF